MVGLSRAELHFLHSIKPLGKSNAWLAELISLIRLFTLR